MGEENKKIFKLGSVMSNSLEMYTDNKQLLLKLSFFSVTIAIISKILTKVGLFYSPPGSLALALIGFVISWITYYYSLRFDVSMMIAISEIRETEERSIKDYYSRAKEFVWPIIGISILFGFIIFIPMLMIMAGSFGFIDPLGRSILWVIGGILLILAVVKFQFATILRIFSPSESDWFAASNRLVKGNFFKAMILSIILYSIPLISSAFGTYVERLSYSSTNISLGIIIEYVVLLLFKPYQLSLQVLAYQEFNGFSQEEKVIEEI